MIRFFEDSDYEIVCQWWDKREIGKVPSTMLPKLGVVWIEGDRPGAMGWLYMDNSTGVCFPAWFTADPDLGPKAIYRGITNVLKFLENEAKSMKYGAMIAQTNIPGLAAIYSRHGFQKGDESMVQLFKSLEVSDGN